MDACAVCGRPARYLAAFPSGASVGASIVYDGAQVCSKACALKLREQRAQAPGDASGEGIGETIREPDGE